MKTKKKSVKKEIMKYKENNRREKIQKNPCHYIDPISIGLKSIRLNAMEAKIAILEDKLNKLSNTQAKSEPKKEYKRPKAEKGYCAIDDNGNIALYTDCGTDHANYRYAIGNYYSTVEEAERAKEKQFILQELKDLAMELNAGERVDWRKGKEPCHIVHNGQNFVLKPERSYRDLSTIYCLSPDFLDVALKRIGEERLNKLFAEE